MQLTFDSDVEAFRAEFVAFLTEHLPTEAVERSRSGARVPEWARRWQRLLFDNGWLLPANPPEFGGRNATVLQQYVHLEELSKRRIYHSFNPQGVGIVAASLLSFGTQEQKCRWAVPILRAEITRRAGNERAGRGFGSGRVAHPRGARRRGVRGGRAEGVDLRRPRRRRSADLRPYRSGGPEASGNQRPADSHRPAGGDETTVPLGVLAGRPRLQRGLLRRRPGARGEPGRRAESGLVGGHRLASSRTHAAVAGVCRPARGSARRLPAAQRARPRRVREAGHGRARPVRWR